MNNYFINNPNNQLASNLTSEILRKSNAMDFHQSLSVYQSTPLINLSDLAHQYNVGQIFI